MLDGRMQCHDASKLLTQFTLVSHNDCEHISLEHLDKVLKCLNSLRNQIIELLTINELHKKAYLLTAHEIQEIIEEKKIIERAIGCIGLQKRRAMEAGIDSILTISVIEEMRNCITAVLYDIENAVNYTPRIITVLGV